MICSGLTVLIETLWNVNIQFLLFSNSENLVLIETLWNVNTDLYNVLDAVYGVLIETLWNVNGSYKCGTAE